jgi:hypothetical protein
LLAGAFLFIGGWHSHLAPERPPMKFFADTADTSAIRELAEAGLIDGVTTRKSVAWSPAL